MKFKIHSGHPYDDSFIIECDTIDKCRGAINKEVEQRGWINPWSERMSD